MAESDFSKPLAVLKKCHERIRSECEALRALCERVKAGSCDDEARRAAAAAIRYFDTGAHVHHLDEEEDLLPRMMAAATMSRGSSLTRLVADIANDHREMDRAWKELRAQLQDVTAGETRLDPLSVDRLIKLYHGHMVVEEANLFPLAEMLLSRRDLEEIGANMAQRRRAL